MPRAAEEQSLDWRPGRVEYSDQKTGDAPRWACVFDDGGRLVARFKRTDVCVKVSFDELEIKKSAMRWKDCTDLWPRFPKWVRQAVEQLLNLRRDVHTVPSGGES